MLTQPAAGNRSDEATITLGNIHDEAMRPHSLINIQSAATANAVKSMQIHVQQEKDS